MPPRDLRRFAGTVLAVGVGYILLARVGFLLAIPPGNVTVVWPPSGLALAATIVAGAPAVLGTLLGSFAVNLWFFVESGTQLSVGAGMAGAIAVGSAAQAWLAARAVRTHVGPHGLPGRGAEGVRFAATVFACCFVGATMGVVALGAGDLLPPTRWAYTWYTWWLGDAAGALVVGPVLLLGRQAHSRLVGLRDFVFPAVGVGLGITGTLFHLARGLDEQRVRAALAADCQTAASAVERELADRFRQVEAVALFHSASKAVERQEFEDFVGPYFERGTGLSALSINGVVPWSGRAAYEDAVRAQGLPGFAITERSADGRLAPAGESDVYYPVQFIEPLASNTPALGFDLGSESVRRAAIERMIATGRVAATDPIRLVQEPADQRSILLFWPLFEQTGRGGQSGRSGRGGSTDLADDAPLVAFVSGVVRVGNLLDEALRGLRSIPVDVRLYHGREPEPGALIASSRQGAQGAAGDGGPALTLPVTHADVEWTVACWPRQEGARAAGAPLPWVLLLGGTTLTVVLALYLRSRADAVESWLRELQEQRRSAEARIREHERRQQIERERDASTQRLRSVVLSTSDAVVIADGRGRICSWNRGAEQTLGHREDEARGRDLDELFPERCRDAWREALDRTDPIGDAAAPRAPVELTALRSDGREVPVEVSLSRWTEGGDVFSGAIIRDLSERRRLEETLQQSQKMEAIGRLAGGVAHDFNNLLTVIVSYAGLLLETLPETDEDRSLVAEIDGAARRAAALTRQLLAFSRKQVLAPVVLDPNRLIRDMLQMLGRLIGEDVRIMTVLDPAVGRLRVDPGQMAQVIMNLVINARDAMPNGGAITIETHPLAAAPDGAGAAACEGGTRRVRLLVRDTGSGMDAETRSRIFEPFFTTKESGRGTGLGLATVHGIVTQSGGHIDVTSSPGEGTVFVIDLPCAEEPHAEAAQPGEQPAAAGANETILLVEDDDPVRRAEARMLASAGYHIIEASNGAEALARANETLSPIHLVVTDLVMPVMNGRELAGHIMRLHPEARILFVSGYPDQVLGPRGVLPAGASFLEKPFTPAAFLARVREAAARSTPG